MSVRLRLVCCVKYHDGGVLRIHLSRCIRWVVICHERNVCSRVMLGGTEILLYHHRYGKYYDAKAIGSRFEAFFVVNVDVVK